VPLTASFTLPEETMFASDVGFSTINDAEGNDFHYLLSWVHECDRTGPCDPTPSAFSTYRFTVDHDAAERVLCSGTITTPSTTRTVCDFALPGGPTYSTFGFMAGRSWTETPLGTWGSGVNVTLFDSPSTGIAAALHGTSLRAFFEFMETTFGDYPYGSEMRLVTAPTYWSGFEHPGNIALNDRLATAPGIYADPLTHVSIHEIAHQWAGDETTLAGLYDFAWKEAMAEYLSYVFEDERLEPGIALDTARAWKQFAVGSDYFVVPEENPALFSFYGDVYGPGPMILFRQIEGMYGRLAVMAALQDLLGEERAIGVDDVRAALESSASADLGVYFDGWVYGIGAPAWPRATIGVSDAGGGDVTVSTTLTTTDGIARGCRFTVQLLGTAGNAYDVPFDFGPDAAPVAPQTVTPGFTVTGTTLDPYAECLVYPASFTGGAKLDPWVAR
jgi:aminopeptidase N